MKKAVIVGDNIYRTEVMMNRVARLLDYGFTLQGLDWLARSSNEMSQWNLIVEKQGPESVNLPGGLAEAAKDAELLLVHFAPVPRSIIETSGKLQVIGVARGGWENIDSAAATERGIPIIHVEGRNASAVAEFTLGLILAEMRNIARADYSMRAGKWRWSTMDINHIYELNRKTIGVVGFGSVGQTLARRLVGFDVEMLVYDPYVSASVITSFGGEQVSLDFLCHESDVISVHARLTSENKGLIGPKEFARMKPTAYLINTARADLIDEVAFMEAMQRGRIAGAALDVFWTEPLPPDSPLLQLDNLTITGHLSGGTIDAFHNSGELLVNGILDYLIHGKTNLVVNPESLLRGKVPGSLE